MSSRLPIGVGQTISSPGISRPPCSSSIRAIAAAPIMPASGPSSAATTGVPFIGGSARPRSSSPRRVEQQVAGARSRRRRSRSPRARRCWRSWPGRRRAGAPTRSKTPIAVASPASAASVTALPSISRPSASIVPSAESGSRSAAVAPLAAERRARGERLDAAVAGAVALAGRAVHRRSPCGPARRRRRSSRGRARRRGSGRRRCRCRSSASPRCRRPRAAPKRCSASAATLASLSTKTGRPVRSADQVADRQVVDRQVDRGDRDPALVVDRGRDPEADGGDAGACLAGLVDLADQQLDQLVLGLPGRALAALVADLGSASTTPTSIFVPPRSTPMVSSRSSSIAVRLRGGRPRASA